jgi:hypothetical protein
MTFKEAFRNEIIIKDEKGSLKYNGKCKDCKHSKHYAYPTESNMCMNEKSGWFGMYHVDYKFERFVNGCECIEKNVTE